jgi:hypothetical protein
MDAERFAALTAAYGGEPQRWPQAERAGAAAFMAADRTLAERILFEARMIDALLDASPAPRASHALREAILASAPQPRPERRPLFDFGRWAVAGAALACACVVGVMAGAGAVQRVTADSQADAIIADADGVVVLDEQETFG